jgi:hypothetical protein
MSRIVLGAAIAAILVLVFAFVPVGGKTLVERWNGAPSASAFAEKGLREVSSSWDRLWGDGKAARPAARPAPARAAAARPGRQAEAARPVPEPVEHHTDADRSALDRIVAEHASDPPAPPR